MHLIYSNKYNTNSEECDFLGQGSNPGGMNEKSVRPEVRGSTDFDGGAYPPPKTSPSYALTTLIIFRFGRAGRDR